MSTTYRETPTFSYNQRPMGDDMLFDRSPPPVYDEKEATIAERYPFEDKSLPTIDDKEVVPSSSTNTPTDQGTPLSGGRLTFHHANFPWRSVNISHPTGQPAYHAEVSEATPGKPDVNLRRADRDGPSIGRSHFRLSRSMRLGLGAGELDTQWYELKSSALFSKGAFEFPYGDAAYRLERTHAEEDGVAGMQKINLSHFKVVQVATGALVALYRSETYHPARMKGTLTLGEGVDEGLEVLIVMGMVGWREKMRRRAAYSGGAHGGE